MLTWISAGHISGRVVHEGSIKALCSLWRQCSNLIGWEVLAEEDVKDESRLDPTIPGVSHGSGQYTLYMCF